MADNYLESILPNSEAKLREAARSWGVDLRLGLQSVEGLKSGSKVTDPQYYALRSIVSYRPGSELDTSSFIEPYYEEAAEKKLNSDTQFDPFTDYLFDRAAGNPPGDHRKCGMWAPVISLLERIAPSPSERAAMAQQDTMQRYQPRHQATTGDGNENSDDLLRLRRRRKGPPALSNREVSCAIWVALMSIGGGSARGEIEWRTGSYRLQMNLVDSASKKVKLFTALCNGCLSLGRRDDPLFAIVKTKRTVRRRGAKKTMKHETALMAAFIKSHPYTGWFWNRTSRAGNKCRLLVALNKNELYLVIGEYSDDYVRYLEETATRRERPKAFKPLGAEPFLEMRTYGPWLLDSSHDMKDFAKKLLAFTIRLKLDQ